MIWKSQQTRTKEQSDTESISMLCDDCLQSITMKDINLFYLVLLLSQIMKVKIRLFLDVFLLESKWSFKHWQWTNSVLFVHHQIMCNLKNFGYIDFNYDYENTNLDSNSKRITMNGKVTEKKIECLADKETQF